MGSSGILTDSVRVETGGANGSEITATLGRGEHGVCRRGAGYAETLPLVICEEEKFILEDRAADRAAILVLFQRRLDGREEVLRLQAVVAVELPGAAVPRVGAGLGDDVDDRTGIASVFGVV